jgi:hypothetical protein
MRAIGEALEVLEPTLTRHDLGVLAVLPSSEPAHPEMEAVTLWQVGEALRVMDLREMELTLTGLLDLGYAVRASSRRRRRTVWWRTGKGDAALRGESAPAGQRIGDIREELGVRAYNCLGRARLFQLEEVARATDTELLALPNFGVKCLERVRAVVPYRATP